MQDTKNLHKAEYKPVQSLISGPLGIFMRNLFLTTRFEVILQSVKHTKIVVTIMLLKIKTNVQELRFGTSHHKNIRNKPDIKLNSIPLLLSP